MPHLHRLSDISSRHSQDFQQAGIHNPAGQPAYMSGGQTLGRVADALVDNDQGRIRYLVVNQDAVNQSSGDLNGAALIPIGLARIENDGVYFDDLTSAQFASLHRYSDDEEYTFEHQSSDERILRGQDTMSGTTTMTETTQRGYNYRDDDTSDRMFKTPQRLQLLEERLSVNKERYLAGSIQIGKHVETHQEQVAVPLEHEEVVIERHAVADGRPADGNVQLGDNTTVRVDVEAERANIDKQAFVTEEVSVGKRTVTETETHTAQVSREVLDVEQSGDVDLNAGPDGRRDRNS